MDTVRCRIAPSPSGFLHIGTAKTAMYNWLLARSTGGSFVLRLEDTDAERTDETYVQAMCEGFKWLGILWDEGPEFGVEPARGEYGPYRQSQRRELHRSEGLRLLAEHKAYKCFCSKEELDAERERATQEKRPPRYSGKCKHLTPNQVAELEAKGTPYVVRFRVPEGETIIHDLIQGDVHFDNKEYDDFIILKANGDPIFHLAVVVDDGHMKITHVIRGDDHLTNAGRHVMLFNALGYPVPKFAHHPLVLDEVGRKYSKRLHGANVLDWREDGYLPETLINYIALLGWTSEEANREFFTLDEMISLFTIERLSKSPARFDRKKLDWLNGQHIRRLTPQELCDRVLPILHKNGLDTSVKSPEWLAHMAAICQEKIPTLNNIVEYTDFFFQDIAAYEEKAVAKLWKDPASKERMRAIQTAMQNVAADQWNHDGIKAAFEALMSQSGEGLGKFVHPTRLALTGKSVGPGLFELAELLGKEECLNRIAKAIAYIEPLGGNVS
ncbi:MAG TPA: glutamate--tRNA ligase [Candidatus Hydrogenedentes bacterium]|nr:glutamate--tRNA ligase [Candidatus Hydrogenedentota bacterium]